MNQRPRKGHCAKPCSLQHFEEEEEDYKDVYFPDEPTGELSMAARLRFQFEVAGYGVKTVEKPLACHPVWLIKGILQSAPQFSDDARFLEHVRQILRLAGIQLSKANVTAQRTRGRIHVSFVVPLPTSERKRGELRRLLAELP